MSPRQLAIAAFADCRLLSLLLACFRFAALLSPS
jgi:hypothetical protein